MVISMDLSGFQGANGAANKGDSIINDLNGDGVDDGMTYGSDTEAALWFDNNKDGQVSTDEVVTLTSGGDIMNNGNDIGDYSTNSMYTTFKIDANGDGRNESIIKYTDNKTNSLFGVNASTTDIDTDGDGKCDIATMKTVNNDGSYITTYQFDTNDAGTYNYNYGMQINSQANGKTSSIKLTAPTPTSVRNLNETPVEIIPNSDGSYTVNYNGENYASFATKDELVNALNAAGYPPEVVEQVKNNL